MIATEVEISVAVVEILQEDLVHYIVYLLPRLLRTYTRLVPGR